MTQKSGETSEALALPPIGLSIGVTGHRDANPAFAANRDAIQKTLSGIFDALNASVRSHMPFPESTPRAKTRLHTLIADGADIMSVDLALARDWEIVAPLPFGLALNVAINAHVGTVEDAEALLKMHECLDANVNARAKHIRTVASQARLFALAEQDDVITGLFLDKLKHPDDTAAAMAFASASSERAAIAGKVMIEQSDIIIGIWDGTTRGAIGGTRHMIMTALELGAPVIWIDARAPKQWQILRTPEALAIIALNSEMPKDYTALVPLVEEALGPASPETQDGAHKNEMQGATSLHAERWRPRSNPLFQAYRRIEAVFGVTADSNLAGAAFRSLRQRYETPQMIGTGSGADLLKAARALPNGDVALVEQIEHDVLRRFAWADGVSTFLSDAYRGGMVTNFFLSAFAIIGGIAYLPFADKSEKWLFALFELLLLSAILLITYYGRKRRWHGRWFETRRVAEYFRHAPILLLLGVARAPGRWPRGAETSWPEWYARNSFRALGLPRITVTAAYLRQALTTLLDVHIVTQRDYHSAKAKRLTTVHRNIDTLSERAFMLAVISVIAYLGLKGGGALGIFPHHLADDLSKVFTFFGVLLPTLGGALAGVRYFGDFERFAAISDITAEKLDAIDVRARMLLAAPDQELSFARVSDLAHAVDDVVVSEIENWQAVFGGKHITVPV